MKNSLLYIVCLLALTYNSCNQKKVAGTVKIPDKIEIYNPYVDSLKNIKAIKNENRKIYTFVNVSCSECLARLVKWDGAQNAVKRYNITIIPVCFSEDKFESFKYLFENNKITKITLPLILDLKGKFFPENKALISKTGQLTVLTDKNNNILISGDFLEDPIMKKAFMDKITETN